MAIIPKTLLKKNQNNNKNKKKIEEKKGTSYLVKTERGKLLLHLSLRHYSEPVIKRGQMVSTILSQPEASSSYKQTLPQGIVLSC